MCVYLRTKFQVSSIILTCFRWGNFNPPPSPPQNEPLKSPPQEGLRTPLEGCFCKYIFIVMSKHLRHMSLPTILIRLHKNILILFLTILSTSLNSSERMKIWRCLPNRPSKPADNFSEIKHRYLITCVRTSTSTWLP